MRSPQNSELRDSIREYMIMYYEVTRSHDSEGAKRIPSQSRNELANTLAHLVTVEELSNDEDQVRELEKAKRHIIRGLLDFFKAKLMQLEDTPELDILKEMLRVRLHEVTHIGSSHHDTIRLYSDLLRDYTGVFENPLEGLQGVKSHNHFCERYKVFMQLEAVLSFIKREKNSHAAQAAINIYCESDDFVQDMDELNLLIKQTIANELISTPMADHLQEMGVLDEFERLADNRPVAVEYLFNAVMAQLNLEIVQFAPAQE